MRTAIIADIHANLEALQAVLERIHALNVDKIICLGDIVGYNANPNECVDIIRNKKIVSVMGNHDAGAAGTAEPDNFNLMARRALIWTRDALSPENKQFLSALSRERQVDSFFVFHGSIHDTDRYILYREDVVENFRLLSGLSSAITTGYFGHTHQKTTLIEQQGTISTSLSRDTQDLMPGSRYLINPGSVGQPRDGNPHAAFAIHDSAYSIVTFHRVAYDVRMCQDKILRAGLHPELAERLERGR